MTTTSLRRIPFAIPILIALAMLGAACGGSDSVKTATPSSAAKSTAAATTAASSLPLAAEKILFGAPISLTGSTANEGTSTIGTNKESGCDGRALFDDHFPVGDNVTG